MNNSDYLERSREEYWEKGYVVLRAVFEQSHIEDLRKECDRLWATPGLLDDLNLRSEFRRDVSGTFIADRLDPVLDISQPLLEVASDPRLLKSLTYILGGPTVLLKCKLIRKDPATGGYAPHQDFLYWRWLKMAADKLCSVGIPLYRSDAESGGIELFPGYHDRLLASPNGDTDRDFDVNYIDQQTGEIPAVEVGDLLLFHSLTPHRSGPNNAKHPRTLLLPSYAVTDNTELYATYYKREVARRSREYVGFERFDARLAEVCSLFAQCSAAGS
jgi:ectoine hydroxylase-related dioxygenase (phytanoyl-CoA dioxygenase family)